MANAYSPGWGNAWKQKGQGADGTNRDALVEAALQRDIESEKMYQQMQNAAAQNWAERTFGSYSLANTDGEDIRGNNVSFDSNPAMYTVGPQTSEWKPSGVERTITPQKVETKSGLLSLDGEGEEDDYEPETATDAVNAAVTAGANEKKAEVQQAQAQQNAMQKLQQMLGGSMLSSDDVYNRDYQAYRNAGASDRQARKWAAQNAGQYRLQRITNLNDAFNNMGINEDGSINGMGVNIINMMGREDAYQAGLLGNGRPGLKEQWAIDQQRKMADEAFMRNLYLKQLDYDNRMALREMGGGGRSGGSGGSGGSSGGRSSSGSNKEPERIKQLRKRLEDYYKSNGDVSYDDLPGHLKAAYHDVNEYDQGVAYSGIRSLDFDEYDQAMAGITAMLEGRAGDGRVWSPEEVVYSLKNQKDGENNEYIDKLIASINPAYGG